MVDGGRANASGQMPGGCVYACCVKIGGLGMTINVKNYKMTWKQYGLFILLFPVLAVVGTVAGEWVADKWYYGR
jgi:hypothetical protein